MKLFLLNVLTFATLTFVSAKNQIVTNLLDLQSAAKNSNAGDTLTLKNGTYLNNSLVVDVSNITIQAQNKGEVFLNGTNSIVINGNNISFNGFQFTSGTITGSLITVNGNNNELSQLNFNGYDATHMILISGQYNLVTYCNFQNKPATNLVNHGGTGDMVQIIPNSSTPGYNTIRYCSFKHMPGFGGDYGNECIRIGDSAYSTYISRTVVEYCYFEDTGNGDSEAISVKSKENCLRYNTMINNPDAMFSFRNGDNNVAYSNFFIRSGGIRCKQSNNIYCYNNYFQQAGTNQNHNLPGGGTAPIILEYVGKGYGDNFNFVHNTFYKCSDIKIASGLTNCTWANNIFYSDSTVIYSGTNSGQSFTGNIYQGNLGFTIASGMKNTNPLLVENSNKYYSLSSTSPAIASSSSNYPAMLSISGINTDSNILFDIDGKARPATVTLKDVGCDQYDSGKITNYPLDSCEVGPTYLCPIKTTSISTISSNFNPLSIYPNPSNGEFTVLTDEMNSEIRVLNLFGETITNAHAENGKLLLKMDKDGVYLISVKTTNGIETRKLIVNQ